MEMDSNIIMKNQKLEAFDILRKSLAISATNINFFIFTILTSLPLFCFLVYYESFLQKFLVDVSEVLNQPHHGYLDRFNSWLVPFDLSRKFTKEFPDELIQLGLLYLVPLHLLELSTVLVTVNLGSKIYTEERPMTLKEMAHNPFEKTRLKGTFITSLYVLVLSTCTLLGLIWLATTYYVVFSFFMHHVFFAVWFFPGIVGLLAMYLALSAMCNMSLVISILEGLHLHGTKALALSIYFSCGNECRGLILMLIFFVWEVGLRLPCLYIGCYERENSIGLVAQIGLLCFGKVVKWVACMIYFYDCKNRALEKRLMMKGKKRAVVSC